MGPAEPGTSIGVLSHNLKGLETEEQFSSVAPDVNTAANETDSVESVENNAISVDNNYNSGQFLRG